MVLGNKAWAVIHSVLVFLFASVCWLSWLQLHFAGNRAGCVLRFLHCLLALVEINNKKRKVVHLSFILISVDTKHCVETVKSASTLSITLIAKGNQGLCAGE